MFKRRPSWQEYQILAGDDKKLSHTREYIYPLIEQAIKKVTIHMNDNASPNN